MVRKENVGDKIVKNEVLFYPISYTNHPFDSFAFDDVLQHLVSQDKIPRVRSWVHDNFIILGLQDMRLENLQDGLNTLRNEGYNYIVRNSGGLGVVLDSGVLNISLILPKSEVPTIDNGYEKMYDIIKKSFPELKIDAYEIIGSYCPGNFDLSVNGQKFAGISQRRIKEAVAVQIYLAVEGSGGDRANVMKDFYDVSSKPPRLEMNRDVMISLSELMKGLTVDDAENRILETIKKEFGELKTAEPFNGEALERFDKQRERMVERNERLN